MTRHAQLIDFLSSLADQFGDYLVVAINQREPDEAGKPISAVFVEESDSEICLVCALTDQEVLNLRSLHTGLKKALDRCPESSLMVSEWFSIDEEHDGRVDIPLHTIDVDEENQILRLLY